ncbi:hypothetical protein ACH5RR_021034 [Cinchona calisaya]|uniref:Uncharacterized protein n=1 Tax=Cinchona calisaya TaxID=153742 RepID=A0ABD2ZJM4_9GENT
MDTNDFLYFERAINQEGREYIRDPKYARSQSLSQIDIEISIDDQVTWVKEDKVRFEKLIINPQDENKVNKVKNGIGQIFDALSLVPVNNNPKGNLDHKIAFGKITSLMRPKHDEKVFSLPLRAFEEANLAAFIALWLSRIEVEMLQVEDRCGVLTSRIADLEKSLKQWEKDEQLIRTEICEAGQEKSERLKT